MAEFGKLYHIFLHLLLSDFSFQERKVLKVIFIIKLLQNLPVIIIISLKQIELNEHLGDSNHFLNKILK